jgi:hypothetical protein
MKVNLLFPNKYLKADDLDGKDYTLTISNITVENLQQTDGTKKSAVIVYFEETAQTAKKNNTEEKRLVTNKTNAKSIAKHYGNETDNWIGKKITVYGTTCKAFGSTVDCIRVR